MWENIRSRLKTTHCKTSFSRWLVLRCCQMTVVDVLFLDVRVNSEAIFLNPFGASIVHFVDPLGSLLFTFVRYSHPGNSCAPPLPPPPSKTNPPVGFTPGAARLIHQWASALVIVTRVNPLALADARFLIGVGRFFNMSATLPQAILKDFGQHEAPFN